MTALPSLTLIGCGKMGAAMLEGWLNSSLAAAYTVTEPGGLPEKFQAHPSIRHIKNMSEASDAAASPLIVLAVKPQTMEGLCSALKPLLSKESLVLSIAAGITLQHFAAWLNPAQPIIRCMPNTPAAIGKGISVAVANSNVTSAQKEWADAALRVTGQLEWLKDEALMDAVTALSGSGPAYVFYLIEALAKAGESLGFTPEMAMQLARQTVIGSAALAEAESSTPASILRQNVTSPGGTTEAGLKVLMNGEFLDILQRTLKAAELRGRELGSS